MSSELGRGSSDIMKFLKLAIVLMAIVDSALLLIANVGSESGLGYYEDLATIALLSIGVAFLVGIIPKISDVSLRRTTIVLALGFAFQLTFAFIWYYYWHFAPEPGMPDVGIGDFFYLGSYALWIYATLPYLRRYGSLMGRRSRGALLGYSIVAAIIVLVVSNYWYNAALTYGYDWFAIVVWLSYPVVSTVTLFFILATFLLYGFEGYGKGLLTYYWFYFLVPILLIACADIVNGFTFALSEAAAPAQIDDLLYLGAYASTIAAGIAVIRSHLDAVSVEPSIEQHVLKGKTVRIMKGRGHIVEDPKSVLSFELFSGLLSQGSFPPREGLVMSRRNPESIHEEFGLSNARVTWITTQPGESTVDPTKPNLMAHAVMEFLSKAHNGVVLLDGIESVLIYGDFTRVLKMLEQINDFVMQYQGYLIVPIDPKVFEGRQRAMLERNFETIEVPRLA